MERVEEGEGARGRGTRRRRASEGVVRGREREGEGGREGELGRNVPGTGRCCRPNSIIFHPLIPHFQDREAMAYGSARARHDNDTELEKLKKRLQGVMYSASLEVPRASPEDRQTAVRDAVGCRRHYQLHATPHMTQIRRDSDRRTSADTHAPQGLPRRTGRQLSATP
jgi:hypothetical protein